MGPGGPWTVISPVVVNAYRWAESVPRVVNKDEVLYFRIKMVTAQSTYLSDIIQPYGRLGKREYFIVKDVMRREILHAKTLVGVMGQLYLVSTFGPPCTVCRDPISGQIRDTACKTCWGTGRVPPYNGPYETWWTITPSKRQMELAEDGTGTRQDTTYQIRMIGAPQLKKNDLVVDPGTDKRYYVDVVQVIAEIRQVPVVQSLLIREAPVTDPAYRYGQ